MVVVEAAYRAGVDRRGAFARAQLGVTAHDQGANIGCREIYVEHLHGSELVEHGPRREASRQRFEP